MSLNGVIARFKTGAYTVTRRAAPTVSYGVAVAGAVTTLTNVDMSVQPVTGRHLQVVPEGQHASEVRVIYTLTQLYTRTSAYEPDRITIGSDTYEVFEVRTHGVISGGHYVAYAARVNSP